MTTQIKIESNRRNAQRSTGPKTREGKTASSKNALRHGLLSKEITLPDEDPEAFRTFSTEMRTQLDPNGPLEEWFVERVTANAWRLRRALRVEAGVMACRTSEAQAELGEPRRGQHPLAAGFIRDATGADAVSKLSRYERSLERGMYRALHELQRLQAVRRGDHVPPPAILEVQVSSVDP